MFSVLRTTRSGVTRPRSYCSNTRGDANKGAGACSGGRGAFSGDPAGELDKDWVLDAGVGAWNSSGAEGWMGDAPGDPPPEVNGWGAKGSKDESSG